MGGRKQNYSGAEIRTIIKQTKPSVQLNELKQITLEQIYLIMSQKKETKEAVAGALKPQPTQQELEQAATEMLEEGEMQQRFCSIIIVDLNCKEIHLKTVMYELVFELREFLAEHVYTCFFTNFYFEHAGQRLNEYSELSELDLESNPRIVMKPDKYDEKSARTHIKRMVDILEKPPVLNMVTKSPSDSELVPASRSRSASHASQNNAQDGSEQPDQEEDKKEQVPPPEMMQEQDEKLKKNYEEFYEVIKSHQGEQVLTLTNKDELSHQQKVASSVNQLLSGAIYKSDLNKLQHVPCIESIEFSSNNPVPENRRMAGDLFYLVVRTLENPSYEHGITCSVNGFYKNDSSERVQFAPLPSQKGNKCYSYTLAGCLNQLSSAFGRNLQIYLASILKCEPYFISPIAQAVNPWLVKEEKKIKVSTSEAVSQTVTPTHGCDPKQNREWNEEFQTVRAFNTETYMNRVQKDRAYMKVYQDFIDAAISGAKAIIEGKLTSLNPNEPVRQHVYVYNHIFFSYAVDTPTSYKDLTSSDQFPSFTQANHDVKGLQMLKTCDVPDLHHLATCLVDYKGNRMICQSIIPGILNNSELSSIAEYGTVDDKKQIVATEQFHEKMLLVAEALNIKVNKVIDPTNNKSVEIAGSIEVKGIKGSDKRNYIVDLQGLVPRDANFVGDDFHTCLVRPELIHLYQRGQSMEYASERIKDFSKKLDDERKVAEPKLEEGKEPTEEQKQEMTKRRQEDNLKKLREVERLVKEAPKYTFNTNVYKSNAQLDMTAAELEAEEQNVKGLATFILEKAIPNLVQDLKQQENVPIDSESLEDLFHKRGINMRYLGKVLAVFADFPKQQENMSIHLLQMMGDYSHIKILLEREIYLRSVKHVVNRIIKEERGDSDLHLSQVVAHCLNCILAPLPFIQAMNTGRIKPIDDSVQSNFQFFPEESISSPRKNSLDNPGSSPSKAEKAPEANVSAFEQKAAAAQPNPENMTKKQLKKMKQKLNKQQSAVETGDSDVAKKSSGSQKTSMSEILFKINENNIGEADEFSVEDLFSQSVLSCGLNRLNTPSFYNITPREIYEQVKEIAQIKFDHELPAEQKKLGCLQSVNYKTALMRDLCRTIGVQITLDESKKLLLGNKIKPIVACINEAIQAESQLNAQNKKKKAAQAQALTEAEILADYQYLPFQSKDINQLFANVKQIKHQHADVRACLAQANQFHKENQLDRAFELYSQGINMLLQVTGATNEEVATCITNIASIQFKFGDYLQAIELQTKAIVLQERLLGVDHPTVGHSYETLSMYYHNCGYFTKGFEYLHRALNILQSSVGDYHPEIASIFLKMGLVYQEIENMDAALEAYIQHLDQTRNMFGDEHIQTASSHQAIALCHYRSQNFRKALESQEQAHLVLKKLLPETNQIVTASKQQLDLYFKLSVQIEKQKSVITRAIGENKQKVDPRFLQAIAEARRQNEQVQAAEKLQQSAEQQNPGDEPESAETIEERKQATMAIQRYQGLVKKLQNPNSKRDILDILEYQHMKGQREEYQKLLMQAVAAQKAEAETGKDSAKKEEE